MSDSARVILLAGDGGAGTTTLARRTAELVRELGLSVEEVDASGDDVGDPSEAVVSGVQDTLGLLWREAGADPVLPEEWSGLVGIDLLQVWHHIAMARYTSDVVVIDAGSLVRLRDLVATPGILLRLLDAAMTPRSAMWRSTSGEAGVFESLSAARLTVRDWLAIMRDARTSARLVARPEGVAIPRLLRTREHVTVLGMHVDGIIVSRVPGKKDRRRREERQAALDVRDEYRQRVPSVPVWHSTGRITTSPRGASAVDVLSDPCGTTPRADTFAVDAGADGYELRVPLRDVAPDVRIGVQRDALVLALDGVHAWHDLPSVLVRCEPVQAYRTANGLVVRWEPVRDLWSASLPDPGLPGDRLGEES